MAQEATDIVSTERMRQELFLPAPEFEPDLGAETNSMLDRHIKSAVDICSGFLGMALIDITDWKVFPVPKALYDTEAIVIPQSRFVKNVGSFGYWKYGEIASVEPKNYIDGYTFERNKRTALGYIYPDTPWPKGIRLFGAEVSEGWEAGFYGAETVALCVVLLAKDLYNNVPIKTDAMHPVSLLLQPLVGAKVVA